MTPRRPKVPNRNDCACTSSLLPLAAGTPWTTDSSCARSLSRALGPGDTTLNLVQRTAALCELGRSGRCSHWRRMRRGRFLLRPRPHAPTRGYPWPERRDQSAPPRCYTRWCTGDDSVSGRATTQCLGRVGCWHRHLGGAVGRALPLGRQDTSCVCRMRADRDRASAGPGCAWSACSGRLAAVRQGPTRASSVCTVRVRAPRYGRSGHRCDARAGWLALSAPVVEARQRSKSRARARRVGAIRCHGVGRAMPLRSAV